jgi:hypothetical protein
LEIAAFLIELGADPFLSEGDDDNRAISYRYHYTRRAQRIRSNYTPWDRALMVLTPRSSSLRRHHHNVMANTLSLSLSELVQYGDARLVETIVQRFDPDLTAIDRTVVVRAPQPLPCKPVSC